MFAGRNITATRCTFCGSSRVLEQSENQNALRPESLLPFAVDKKTGQPAFLDVAGQALVPPQRPEAAGHVQEVDGVYVPFWTFDADVALALDRRGRLLLLHRGGIHDAGERPDRQQDRASAAHPLGARLGPAQRSLRRHAGVRLQGPARRAGARSFRPSTPSSWSPYSPGFLAGWRAEEYAVDLQGGFGDGAGDHGQRRRSGAARKDVPGDTQRNLNVTNTFSSVTFKHVLLAGLDRRLSLPRQASTVSSSTARPARWWARRRGAGSRSPSSCLALVAIGAGFVLPIWKPPAAALRMPARHARRSR